MAFFVERVASKENIADGPSRNYWILADRLGIPREKAHSAFVMVNQLLSMNTALLFGAAKAHAAQRESEGE